MDEQELIEKIDKISNGDLNTRRLIVNTLNHVLDNWQTIGLKIQRQHYGKMIKDFNKGRDEDRWVRKI